MINIALVDDHQLFREGIRSLLEFEEDFKVSLECSNGRDFISELDKPSSNIDVVLLDSEMDHMGGLQCTDILRNKQHSVKIIIVSMISDKVQIARFIEAGANSYLLKNCDSEELTRAIRAVNESEYYFNDTFSPFVLRDVLKKALKPSVLPALSEHEIRLFREICDGRTAAEIGLRLKLSKKTIDAQRLKLRDKTGCKSTASLVIYAIKHGIYDPEEHVF